MPDDTARFHQVAYRWIDHEVRDLDPIERLVHGSTLLRSDQRVTNTVGGYASNEPTETAPMTGGAIEALWVKTSEARPVVASIGTSAHYQASDDSATASIRHEP